jgi:hypothetical protein
MVPVYLICGVPGSGKSWVCEQLRDKFEYVEHDLTVSNHPERIIKAASLSLMPVLADCPFAERELRDILVTAGIEIIPLFIVENPDVVAARYLSRSGKTIRKEHLTRASSIGQRALEWQAPYGTSEQILGLLRALGNK